MWHRFLAPFVALASLFYSPSYTHVVDHTQASIVRVTGTKEVETIMGTMVGEYVCSGEVIAPHRVLTANHCLGDHMRADGASVRLVIRASAAYDLALLDVDTAKPALMLRDTPVVRFEHLTALGYAFGWEWITVLDVRALMVDVQPYPEAAPGLIVQPGYIGGMSGGPVVDNYGRMVGIVQQTNEGIGYGVSTLLIRAFLLGA